MNDEEWAIRLFERLAECANGGDSFARYQLLEAARAEANGSPIRRMAITVIEVGMQKIDTEIGAKKSAQEMLERLKASQFVFNGPVTQGAGSAIGEDNSKKKSIGANEDDHAQE